jgi:hypothetical protein
MPVGAFPGQPTGETLMISADAWSALSALALVVLVGVALLS